MMRTRRRFDRDFKISVIAELEAGKPLAQVAREHGIHPSLLCRWKDELAENPEKAFSGNGNMYKDQAKIAELERLLGQAHAEKPISHSCQALEVSRSGYYKWRVQTEKVPSANMDLKKDDSRTPIHGLCR